jgi:hypothetical protein
VATLTSVTRREAKEAVDTYFAEAVTPTGNTSPASIDAIVTALTAESDMQIRDYFLGLTLDYDLDTLIEATSALSTFIPEGNRQGIYSILAVYHYQNSNDAKALEFLSFALDLDSEYSLANLLLRVFRAGWTRESFAEMTRELHPKVIAELDDTIIE